MLGKQPPPWRSLCRLGPLCYQAVAFASEPHPSGERLESAGDLAVFFDG